MPKPLLLVENLCFKYSHSNRWALNEISFQLSDGMILGILGPNGAGKTSLLRCILGIVKPSRGTIQVFNQDIWNISYSEKREILDAIGAHFETPGLYRQLSPREYLHYFSILQNRNISADEIVGLCKQFHLDPDGMPCGKLSQGNRQKLHLARSLIGNPKILLWDEPTDHLDPSVQRNTLNGLVSYVSQSDRGALIASHRIEHLESICTHILILENGEMRVTGRIAELLHTHRGGAIHWEQKEWPTAIEKMFQEKMVMSRLPNDADQSISNGMGISATDEKVLPDLIQSLSVAGYRILHAAWMKPKLEDLYHEALKDLPILENPVEGKGKQTAAQIQKANPALPHGEKLHWIVWNVFKHEIRLIRREPRFLIPFILISLVLVGAQGFLITNQNHALGLLNWESIKPMFAILSVISAALCVPIGSDAFAGERERNSLELLWISTQNPAAIFFGKVFSLLPFSILLGWAGQALLFSWIAYLGMDFRPIFDELIATLCFTPVIAFFIASFSIAISSRAQSVRSASQNMAPILFGCFILIPWLQPIMITDPKYWIPIAVGMVGMSYLILLWAKRKWLKPIHDS